MITLLLTVAIFFLAVFLIGFIRAFINMKHQYTELEKRCRSLVHKLRTPLGTIQTGALGIRHYLPILISFHEKACREITDTVEITPLHLKLLSEALGNIEAAVQNANNYLQKFI